VLPVLMPTLLLMLLVSPSDMYWWERVLGHADIMSMRVTKLVIVVESTSLLSNPHRYRIHVIVVKFALSNPCCCRICVVVVESASFDFHCGISMCGVVIRKN